MPLETKIVLSDKELALVKNTEWILTKQQIIQKVSEIFNAITTHIDQAISLRPESLLFPVDPPKISKGENYLGLPYVMLDHPRIFNRENIFAVRTMFWWGNFFSITLHVSGVYKEEFEKKILANYHSLTEDMFVCIHNEQWHHHFESKNYIPVHSITKEELESILSGKGFIKLAIQYKLDQFNCISEMLQEGYKKIAVLI